MHMSPRLQHDSMKVFPEDSTLTQQGHTVHILWQRPALMAQTHRHKSVDGLYMMPVESLLLCMCHFIKWRCEHESMNVSTSAAPVDPTGLQLMRLINHIVLNIVAQRHVMQ